MPVPRTLVLSAALFLTVSCSEQPMSSPSAVGTAAGVSGSVQSSGNESVTARSSTPSTATVQFGQPNAGSPFPPPQEHDASGHAADNLVPRTVVISAGGTVTFNTFGVHQVAIYDAGTEPSDINTNVRRTTPCIPGNPPLLINDATNRLAVFDQPCAGGPTAPSYTFDRPGRYLVICAFLPHFEVQMWGWVIVKE
jgi:plastocyanin